MQLVDRAWPRLRAQPKAAEADSGTVAQASYPEASVRADYLDAQARSAGESIAQVCRWVFIALVALLANLGFIPAQDRVLVDLLLGIWVLVSVQVTAMLLLRQRPGRLFTFALTGVDLLIAAALVYFSNGYDSPFFLALFLTVITSAVRSGVWAGLIASGVIGALYLSIGGLAPRAAPTPHDVEMQQLGRVFMVFMVGAVTALMTRELLRERGVALKAATEAEALRELAVSLAGGLGRDGVISSLLERAMLVTGAVDAALFLVSGDEITRVGSRVVGEKQSFWQGSLDRDLVSSSAGAPISLADGTVLLVPVQIDGATRALLGLRSQGPMTPRARFLAAAMGTTVSGAIAGSLKLQKQARELEMLRNRARDLAAQDRRRADVFSLVSHELRRPLAVLNVYSELLRRDLGAAQSDGSVAAMATMAASLREMDLLIDQLHMMARLDVGEPTPHPAELDLQEQVELAVRAVEPLATPRHRLTIACPHPVGVRADPQHVQLILTNLIGNAIKYSPEGGEVRCEIATERHHGVVEISDEGIGIGGQERSLLFKRFSRLPNAREAGIGGSGLGLYICRRLVRLQGGYAGAEPRAPAGSTFRVALPLTKTRA